jgi:uncharacterized repeat protein (TIGR03803 family)
LIVDAGGTLYGTTYKGGPGRQCGVGDGCGTVYSLSPAGVETVIHGFLGGCDGAFPYSSLLADKAGNFYGTTSQGGDCNGSSNYGTIFKVAADGTESVLYAFQGGSDGASPLGNLIADKKGNFYGTTEYGGNSAYCSESGPGCGTVFELTASGTKKTLYVFQGGSDGASPVSGLIIDKAGNLYGVTPLGGGNTNCLYGCGTVFEITPGGTETVLYAFGSNAASPAGNLIADKAGNLYGTTTLGGAHDQGTVFEIAAGGSEAVLYSFRGDKDGAEPQAGLIADGNGNFYGTTMSGAYPGGGSVFSVTPSGFETVLDHMTHNRGEEPVAPLVLAPNGLLYGTTVEGGDRNGGSVFSVPTAK